MQAFALVTVTVFGRSSPHTKRCVYLCTATITSIECKKRLCMPVRGKCHGQDGARRVVFIQPHSSISYLSVCLIFRFPLLCPHKYSRVLTWSPFPGFCRPALLLLCLVAAFQFHPPLNLTWSHCTACRKSSFMPRYSTHSPLRTSNSYAPRQLSQCP